MVRVADCKMVRPALTARELVTIEDSARWKQRREDGLAGFLVGRFADPEPHPATLPAHHLEDARAVISEGAMPRLLVRPSTGGSSKQG